MSTVVHTRNLIAAESFCDTSESDEDQEDISPSEIQDRTNEDKKRLDNFWEGVNRGIEAFNIRKSHDTSKNIKHGVNENAVSTLTSIYYAACLLILSLVPISFSCLHSVDYLPRISIFSIQTSLTKSRGTCSSEYS